MIDLVGYDREEKTLEVRFIHSGQTYRYFDVPQKVFKGLMAASSKGSFMRDEVIDCFEWEKVGRRRRG